MKQFLLFALLAMLAPSVLAQTVQGQVTNAVVLPSNPIISFCNAPANGVPCTNKATTYTSAALTTACPSNAQIVLDGTTACVASPDQQNNWGVWAPPGQYAYTVTVGGTNFGPYYVTLPVTATSSDTFTNKTLTFTDLIKSPAPANPQAGNIRIYGDTGTGNFTCLTSTGTNCLPGVLSIFGRTGSVVATPTDYSAFKILNNIRFADQFAGSDAGAQIAAAIADLPAVGGTVDARGYGGSTQTISAQLILGSATKPVTLLVSQQTTFNITVTGGVDAVQVPNGSAIVSDGLGEQLGGVGARFQLASSANVNSIIANADRTGAQEFIYLRGLVLRGNASATMTSAALDLQGIFTNSVVRDVYTEVIAGKALRLRPGSSTLKVVSDIMFDNDNFDCTAAAGGIPVSIESAAGSEISGITFIGGAIQHAGSGQSLLVINGAGVSGGTGAHNIQFYGTHFETSTGGASSAITIADASHIVFYDLALSGPAATNVINISQTVSNASHDIEVLHLRTSTGWTNTINNAVNSTTVTADIGHYYFGGGAAGAGGAGQITYDVVPVFRSGISGTAGQVLSLPASASTLAALGVAQSWTANQTNVPLVTPTIGGGSTITRYNLLSATISPTSVTANSCADQTATFTGATTSDIVIGWQLNASVTAGVWIGSIRATSADTLTISYCNTNAIGVTPTGGTLRVLLVR